MFGAGEGIRTLDPNLGKVVSELRVAIRSYPALLDQYDSADSFSHPLVEPVPNVSGFPIITAYRTLTIGSHRAIVSKFFGEREDLWVS